MLKKLIILTGLVIVLISLNWFRELVAQDISQLSEQEKHRLLQRYHANKTTSDPSGFYQSQDFFEGDNQSRNNGIPQAGDIEASGLEVVVNDRVRSDNRLQPQIKKRDQLEQFDDLRPFGSEFFDQVNQSSPPVDIVSTNDYVLGPGDNLVLYLWGRVEKEYNLTIDREGKLFIPTVGTIPAWGLTLDQFLASARRQFSKAYSDFDITCSLTKVRSVRIYVTGEVQRPGAYTVSALTSLFNALYLGGGPTDRGSMRNIQLKRRGECVAKADLYKLMLEGDNSTDIRLESGDVIFVPVVGPRAAIRGEVKRSAVYELAGDETVLDLLKLAGNATAKAYLNRVMLERIAGRESWEVVDLNLNPASDSLVDVNLSDGDRITVYSIFDLQRNMVALFGQVQHSGYYERTDSTCLSDIINVGKLHPYDVYLDRADIFRHHDDWRIEVIPVNLGRLMAGDAEADISLCDRDSIHIYAVDEVEWEQKVYIEGAVRNPGWYHLYDGMNVADLIFLAGNFTRAANRVQGELARLNEFGEVSLQYMALDENSAALVPLQQDDHLFVRQIPQWREDRSVSITGEVLYPGTYVLSDRDETLYELIRRAGGFAHTAFPTGLILKRPSIEHDLKRIGVAELLARTMPIVTDSMGNTERQKIVDFDANSLNRIIIDMDRLIASHGQEGDVVLQANDQIYIPAMPSGVSVMGEVGSNGTLKFVAGKNVKFYVKNAGNFTRQADKKSTRLIKPTGHVFNDGSVLGREVTLGDVIVIPTRIQKDRNWNKIVSTTLTAMTSILTSVYIVSNL